MKRYDCLVAGVGGVGSAALFHLAQKGARVLGVDRFVPGHDRGSSHGDTRIFRLAYFEHPGYVPLLRRAFELWQDLSRRSGVELYRETGLLEAGPPDGVVVPGVLKSAKLHGLRVEPLSAGEAERRFPGFRIPASMSAVFEPGAGYLQVEACVEAHVRCAVQLGAEIVTGANILGWEAGKSGVRVETDRGVFSASRLVLAPGAWAADLLKDLGIAFEVRRKAMFWHKTLNPGYLAASGFPAFLFETPQGNFYGFPEIDAWGLKAAEHSGGQITADPLRVSRDIDPEDRRRIGNFLGARLPGVSLELKKHSVCLYTMTPDENFVVGRHPRHRQVCFAAGLSGHGFKFASVLGEILSDLALEGKTRLPIDFLNCLRQSLSS
ncbi:MAG: N-methyl-L-tryptophan oxidase [Elusimicrobia bacterium]|nr:N-methyl-L-tryptophan oxidase [Elusimicrobiota bacterium]